MSALLGYFIFVIKKVTMGKSCHFFELPVYGQLIVSLTRKK